MSIEIIRPGLLDTIQDTGRNGFRHLGINPGGAMDRFSARLANALLGNALDEPVIEFHFPAAQLRFLKPAIISLCGGDFTPSINGVSIPGHHPIAVAEGAVLSFAQKKKGARVYMAFHPGLQIEKWLGSYGTNLKAEAGGWLGRALKNGDCLVFNSRLNLDRLLDGKAHFVFPWKSYETVNYRNEIDCLIGNEWSLLTPASRQQFIQSWYQILQNSDRMGYRLAGSQLEREDNSEMVSSAVDFGTIQLLPSGQLIVLMADHQTTGGYPRIASVCSGHLPILAQKGPNDVLRFRIIHLEEAEEKVLKQEHYLTQLALACTYRFQEFPGLQWV